jgi:hypothetical protein
MKKIAILVFAIVALSSCKSSLSTDDYSYVGPSPAVIYDNEENQCRDGGVASEWCVKGAYKVFDGEIYVFYVTPEEKVYPYYMIWEKARYYQTYRSETGWVRLDDVQQKNVVSRIRNTNAFFRHVKV